MNALTTLHAIGTNALDMIAAARDVAMTEKKEEVLFVASEVGVDIEPTVSEDAARFILLANLVVMEKNTITFFRL